jgi:hypothetical protein
LRFLLFFKPRDDERIFGVWTESNDDVTFCATVDFFTVFPFFNTFVDEAAFKTGGGRRRGTTDAAFAADDDATTREDLLLPEEAVIFSLSLSKIM